MSVYQTSISSGLKACKTITFFALSVLTLYCLNNVFQRQSVTFPQIAPLNQVAIPEVKKQQRQLQPEIHHGYISYSLIQDALDSGISDGQIKTLFQSTAGLIDLITDIQRGGYFSILSWPSAQGGSPEKFAFLYHDAEKEFFIYRSQTGHLYDQYGESLSGPQLLTRPLNTHYRITSPFNALRRHPITGRYMPHNGTDYATPVGTQVFTAASGVVVKSGYDPLSGHYIRIQHDAQTVTQYLHLSKRLVAKGERVHAHQCIGLTGNSGRTTGPHLHFELRLDGQPIDFERYMRRQPTHNRPLFARETTDPAVVRQAYAQLHRLMQEKQGAVH